MRTFLSYLRCWQIDWAVVGTKDAGWGVAGTSVDINMLDLYQHTGVRVQGGRSLEQAGRAASMTRDRSAGR